MDAKLTIVDVTGSTNDDLLEAGKQGAPHGTGLAARAQRRLRSRTRTEIPSALSV